MDRTMLRRAAAGISVLGMTMIGMSALAPLAPASADAPGTVKIVANGEELTKQHGNVDNDPHVDCSFTIVFNGFDSLNGKQVAADLAIQDPSATVGHVVFHHTATISGGHAEIPVPAGAVDFNGMTANHTENGNNDSEKNDTADPNEQTFHVSLDTYAIDAPGDAIAKQKTFWLGGCETSPTVSTVAHVSGGTQLPNASLTDTATFSGLSSVTPTGTVTFNVYGPFGTGVAPTCNSDHLAHAPYTGIPIGTGVVTSPAFVPTHAGTYWWTASYSGDANNASATEECGGANESKTVTPASTTPALATVADATNSGHLPTVLTDTADLTGFGENGPSGTVVFKVWGPYTGDTTPTCTGTPAKTFDAVTAAATTHSGSFSPTAPGVYVWTAVFTPTEGEGTLTEGCNGDNETTTVQTLTISTAASATNGGVLPTSLSDVATLANFIGTPGGTMTFNLYGPFAAGVAPTCTEGKRVAGPLVVTVTGAATESPEFAATVAGTYVWTADYSGDDHNAAAHEGCNGTGESITVTSPPPVCVVNCNPIIPTPSVTPTPAVTVVKTNDAGGHPFAKTNTANNAGDSVDFLAVITNTSSESETITSITDAWGANSAPECAKLINTVLASGASVSCGFTISGYAPPAGSSLVDTVTVSVKDVFNQTANAFDTSTVTTPAAAVLPEVVTTVAPTTTVPPTTTTTLPPARVLPLTGSRTLPFTGTNARVLLLAGLGLILLGLGLLAGSWKVAGQTDR